MARAVRDSRSADEAQEGVLEKGEIDHAKSQPLKECWSGVGSALEASWKRGDFS